MLLPALSNAVEKFSTPLSSAPAASESAAAEGAQEVSPRRRGCKGGKRMRLKEARGALHRAEQSGDREAIKEAKGEGTKWKRRVAEPGPAGPGRRARGGGEGRRRRGVTEGKREKRRRKRRRRR